MISVVALMKAGKSTLLNSLLHQEFLPSAAQAATACVTRIIHDDGVPHGRLESEGRVRPLPQTRWRPMDTKDCPVCLVATTVPAWYLRRILEGRLIVRASLYKGVCI